MVETGHQCKCHRTGVFRTDLNSALLDGSDRGRELLMRTPMQRFGKGEELIGAAILLSSDAASFIREPALRWMAAFWRRREQLS